MNHPALEIHPLLSERQSDFLAVLCLVAGFAVRNAEDHRDVAVRWRRDGDRQCPRRP